MAGQIRHTDVATNLTQTEYHSTAGHEIVSGATGDLLHLAASGDIERIPIGSANKILGVSGGIPAWTASLTLSELIVNGDLSVIRTATEIGDARHVAVFEDDTAMATGVGGGIMFKGKYKADGTRTVFGWIWAEKENGVEAEFGGQLHLGARIDGGTVSSNIIIGSSGNVFLSRDLIVSSGNITLSGELKGSRQSILFSNLAGGVISDGDNFFLTVGEIDSENQGVPMIRPGSIVGVSIAYNVSADSGTLDDLSIHVQKNEGNVFSLSGLSVTVGNNKTNQSTQARGTDTFVAGDRIAVQIVGTDAGVDSATVNSVIAVVETVYDT